MFINFPLNLIATTRAGSCRPKQEKKIQKKKKDKSNFIWHEGKAILHARTTSQVCQSDPDPIEKMINIFL